MHYQPLRCWAVISRWRTVGTAPALYFTYQLRSEQGLERPLSVSKCLFAKSANSFHLVSWKGKEHSQRLQTRALPIWAIRPQLFLCWMPWKLSISSRLIVQTNIYDSIQRHDQWSSLLKVKIQTSLKRHWTWSLGASRSARSTIWRSDSLLPGSDDLSLKSNDLSLKSDDLSPGSDDLIICRPDLMIWRSVAVRSDTRIDDLSLDRMIYEDQ